MEALRMEMLEDYTFTPQLRLLGKPDTRSVNPTSSTTKSASSGESVFSRLYRGGSPKNMTPKKNVQKGNFNSPGSESARVTADLGVSRRLEEAYQKKVAKMRARPLSEKHETLLRIRNLENKEMEECTFWPKTNWGMTTNMESTTTVRSTKLAMKPSAPVRPVRRIQPRYRAASKVVSIPDLKREEPPLPKEIIVTRIHPWDSPMRHQINHHILTQTPVSPLRELSLVQNMVMIQAEKDEIRASHSILQKKARDTQHSKERFSLAPKNTPQSSEYGSI